MSIYSYTRLGELSAAYISTRTCNVCKERNMTTVKDVWDYYLTRRRFRNISQIGKEGEKQLQHISRKAAEVMGVMPLTVGAEAPTWIKGFSLVGLYPSMTEEGRQIAENFYSRFIGHMRGTSLRRLEDECGDLTLASFLNTMSAQPKLFQMYRTTRRGLTSEIGQMIPVLYTFFQSDLYHQYMEKPTVTLLRQEMHRLMGCLHEEMDAFLVRHGESLTTGTFPLTGFIAAIIAATKKLPGNTKRRWRKELYECDRQPLLAVKVCQKIKETHLFEVIQPAIALIEKLGYTLPAYYQLPDMPFHTGRQGGEAAKQAFSNLFVTLLYNPGYTAVAYRNHGWPRALLVKNELEGQFDFTDFLREVYGLKTECIKETYVMDLLSLMDFYIQTVTTEEEDEKLMRIVAAVVEDVYDLTTDSEGGLELKRTSKKQTWEYIEDVLTRKGKPCTVGTIWEELKESGVDVKPETIRSSFAYNRNLFSPTANGAWGLVAWKKANPAVASNLVVE